MYVYFLKSSTVTPQFILCSSSLVLCPSERLKALLLSSSLKNREQKIAR